MPEMDNTQAIVAAAGFVANDDAAFDAVYDANRNQVRGASRAQARQVLRESLTAYPRVLQGVPAVDMAARWLANSDQFLQRAVDAAVRAGTLDAGTTVGQARQFLLGALGAPQGGQAAAAAPVREQARQQFAGQGGEQVTITITAPRDIVRDLLDL
jgi:hypothetical protein